MFATSPYKTYGVWLLFGKFGAVIRIKQLFLSIFSGKFCFKEVEKLMPKIMIMIVPNDMTDEALESTTCHKVVFLIGEMNIDATFSMMNE